MLTRATNRSKSKYIFWRGKHAKKLNEVHRQKQSLCEIWRLFFLLLLLIVNLWSKYYLLTLNQCLWGIPDQNVKYTIVHFIWLQHSGKRMVSYHSCNFAAKSYTDEKIKRWENAWKICNNTKHFSRNKPAILQNSEILRKSFSYKLSTL